PPAGGEDDCADDADRERRRRDRRPSRQRILTQVQGDRIAGPGERDDGHVHRRVPDQFPIEADEVDHSGAHGEETSDEASRHEDRRDVRVLAQPGQDREVRDRRGQQQRDRKMDQRWMDGMTTHGSSDQVERGAEQQQEADYGKGGVREHDPRLGYLLFDVDGGEIESLQRRNDQDQKGDRNQPLAFLRTAEDDERGEHETRRAEQHVDDRQRPRSELAAKNRAGENQSPDG